MIPLTLRSHYSLLWGTASVRQLCRAARRLGYDRLALTDTDNLYGLWPFLEACRQEGLTPIVGAEITDPDPAPRRLPGGRQCGLHRLVPAADPTPHGPRVRSGRGAAGACPGLIVLTSDAGLLARWHAAGVAGGRGHAPHAAAADPPPAPDAPASWASPWRPRRAAFSCSPKTTPCHRLLRAIALNTTLERLPAGQTAPPMRGWPDRRPMPNASPPARKPSRKPAPLPTASPSAARSSGW
jgi:error-prone DNA polymerase